MIRLKCSNSICNKVFKLLDDTKEYIYCPYCGKKVYNTSNNYVEEKTEMCSNFVSQMYQEHRELQDYLKERQDYLNKRFPIFIDDVINTIKKECRINFSKHIIAGVYSHNIGDSTDSFIYSSANKLYLQREMP